MKKLLTLLLAAGMVVSAANGASAVEMKVSGEWMASFTFADNIASIRVLEKNGFSVQESFVEDGRESVYLELSNLGR